MILFSANSFAQTSAFTYEGRLFSSSGIPLLEPVDVKFQILNPAGTCVLYEEVQSEIDLSASKGAFSLGVGSAASDTKRSANFRGAYNPSMISVFRNGATLSGIPAAGCAAGTYVAGSSDSRLLRVHVTKGSTTETLSPDLVINTVPSAQVAASLQGFLPSDFLRLDVANGISGNIGLTATGTGAGQTREFRFYELAANGPEYSAFKAPDAMATSLTYVLPSSAPAAGDILKATVPSSGVVTLSWGADAGAGGGISSFNGSNQSSQSFTAVDIAAAVTAPAWSTNAGTGAHTLQIPMAAGAGVTGGLITKTEHTAFSSKVDRTGDTMTGLLNFTGATGVSLAGTSGITFTGTGTIAMGTNKITGLADPSNAQEAATKAYVDAQNSGKISGTLTATRIPFASGASTVTDDANFIWDNTNKRLGIGSAAPTRNLEMSSAAGSSTGIRLINTAAGGRSYSFFSTNNTSGVGGGKFGIYDDALTAARLVIDAAGSVGIGTTAPVSKLHVGSAPTASANYGLVSLGDGAFDGATAGFFTGHASGTALAANAASGYAGDLMNLQVAGVQKFKVDKDGKIYGDGSTLSNVSGAISGLTATRIPFAASATTIADSANLSYVTGTNQLVVAGNPTTSALAVTGAPTAGATKSLVQVGPAIAGGSANGTMIGVNAPNGFTGNLLDLQVNGTQAMIVDKDGIISNGPGATYNYSIDGRYGYFAATSYGSSQFSGQQYDFALQVASASVNSSTPHLTGRDTFQLHWSANNNHSGTIDTGIGRSAANTIEINKGPAGTRGKLAAGSTTIYDNTAATGVSNLTVKAGAGQAATNLMEFQDNSGTILSRVDSTGKFVGDGSLLTGVSGAISGLTAGRVPVAASATTLSDSVNFTFNSTTGAMGINGTAPSLTSGDAITIAAGGTNKNVVLAPSGTGYTLLNGNVGVGTVSPQQKLEVVGKVHIDDTSNTSIVFEESGDDTAIGHPANNVISFNIGGAERMRLGPIGTAIGTTTPWTDFHIFHSAAGGGAGLVVGSPGTDAAHNSSLILMTKDDGATSFGGAGVKGWELTARGDAWTTVGDRNDLHLRQWDGTTMTTPLIVDSLTGNVGVGVTSPQAKLDVAGALLVQNTAVAPNTYFTAVEHTNTSTYTGTISSLASGDPTVGAFHAGIGITTANPVYALIGARMVGARWTSSPTAVASGDYLPGIGFAGQSNTTIGTGMVLSASILGQVDGAVSSGAVPTSIVFRTSATNNAGQAERMRINSSGNVGIGTTSPGTTLQVSGSTGLRITDGTNNSVANSIAASGSSGGEMTYSTVSGQKFVIDNNSSNGLDMDDFQIFKNNTAGTPLVIVKGSTGNVGIGTTNPQSTLQVNGYLQLALTTGAPAGADCDAAAEHGRMKVDATTAVNRLYFCTADGWKYVTGL